MVGCDWNRCTCFSIDEDNVRTAIGQSDIKAGVVDKRDGDSRHVLPDDKEPYRGQNSHDGAYTDGQGRSPGPTKAHKTMIPLNRADNGGRLNGAKKIG
jgi:hypothetical protein